MLALRSRAGVLPVAGFPLSSSGCDQSPAARAPLYSRVKVRLGFGQEEEEEDGYRLRQYRQYRRETIGPVFVT